MKATTALEQAATRSPDWMDAVNRNVHGLIADKIRRQPHLLGIALENLRRWKRSAEPSAQPILRRWKLILLTWEFEDILQFLSSPSVEAARLRQISPCCGILTEPEHRQAEATAA